MKLLFVAALIGLLASAAVHLAAANSLPLPEAVFMLQVGLLILAVPLAASIRQPPQGAPRLNYWWNAWRESPLKLQALTLLLSAYMLHQALAWVGGLPFERAGLFLRLLSSAWMCAYAIEAAFLASAAAARRSPP